jgi:hypothetical protein
VEPAPEDVPTIELDGDTGGGGTRPRGGGEPGCDPMLRSEAARDGTTGADLYRVVDV